MRDTRRLHLFSVAIAVLAASAHLQAEEFLLAESLGQGVCGNPPACCGERCGSRHYKTLFTWAGQRPTYVTAADRDEPLVTDRPDFTEASSTVGLGRVQLEAGYTYVFDEEGPNSFKGNSFGEPLFRIGMFAEWFELRLFWNYLEEETLAGGIRTKRDGADDFSVGTKIALTEQCGVLPESGIIFQMGVPTGGRSFTADETMPGAVYLYTWEISDSFSIAGNTGINRALDDIGEFYTEYSQSFSAGFGLTDRVGAYVEWFGFFPEGADAPGTGAEHFLNGGFTYLVNNDLQLDVRAGYGLNSRADDFFTGAGFAVRY